MALPPTLGVRRSIQDIQADYDAGKKLELETLMRAWKGVKELPADDPRSFFTIGGFHGEPFRGKGATDANWWGGYCQHGTVLFPSWHRAYLVKLEQALRSIPGCASVTLPFWDECSDASRATGVPAALTRETFPLDGVDIPNPLRSFVLPVAIVDKVKDDPVVYSKPAGYETVRYPLSGLVGNPTDQAATAAHNAQFPDYAKNVGYLNDNIVTWLSGKILIDGRWLGEIYSRFVQSLDAPNYTLFSNTTSAGAWNKTKGATLMSLESPHNYMHLAVGGFDYPGQGDFAAIPGANGDMGENDTAGLDPIFFFHHCFIDYAFWIWQRRHGFTTAFDIEPGDPGANSNADPPPAGIDPNTPLTLDTPLYPFMKDAQQPVTTRDCIDIEGQLGYSYGPGSLDQYARPPAQAAALRAAVSAEAGSTLMVDKIDRARIRGSFLIAAFAKQGSKRQYLGAEAVLSRWHVEGCMNCLNHLEASAAFRLPFGPNEPSVGAATIEVEVRTRDGLLGGRPAPALLAIEAADEETVEPFRVRIF